MLDPSARARTSDPATRVSRAASARDGLNVRSDHPQGDPDGDASWLAWPLAVLTSWVVRYPRLAIGFSLAVAAIAVVVTASGLKFKTSRLDLLNPRSDYNRRWLAYLKEFGDQDDVLVVAHGEDPDKVAAAIDAVAEAFARPGAPVENVLAKRDLSALRSKGLHYLPPADLQRVEEGLHRLGEQAQRFNEMEELVQGLTRLNDQTEAWRERAATSTAAQSARPQLAAKYDQIASAIIADAGEQQDASQHHSSRGLETLRTEMNRFGVERLTADDRRTAFLLFRLKSGADEFARGAQAIEGARKLLDEVRPAHRDVRLGMTGMPVLEFDEMRSSQVDMSLSTWLSLAGVLALLCASFGGWRHAMLSVVVLLVGMAWSFGFLTLVVGHLNILSVSFVAILVGLGIDFGIHYVSHYLQERREGKSPGAALVSTARGVGPGVVTGGLTTAAAFSTAGLTDFVGVAELGIIAGGGILACLIVALIALPAMLVASDRNRLEEPAPEPLPVAPWSAWCLEWPWTTIAITVVATGALAWGIPQATFDDNLLNLQAEGLESVELERDILSRSDCSFWFAVVAVDTPEEATRRKAQFERLATVDRVEETGSLVPTSTRDQRRRIARIGAKLNQLAAIDFDVVERIRPRLLEEVERAAQDAALVAEANTSTVQRWREIADGVREMPRGRSLNETLRDLQAIADPEPPSIADLPKEISSRCIGKTGKHLLRIYPRGAVWDQERLGKFVAELESVDPRVTGHPVQTYYASRHMRDAYLKASLYSLIAVFALLVLDFQSIGLSLMAMLPLALGVVQMIGAMGWLGIPLNPANMIALPLILGIGIDDGVHLTHLFRGQRGRFQLNNATALSVMLTSATTMVGFGSMILARHQGLRSLGQTLALGVFTCFVCSLWSYPALLRALTLGRRENLDEDSAKPENDADTDGAEPTNRAREARREPTSAPGETRPRTSQPRARGTRARTSLDLLTADAGD